MTLARALRETASARAHLEAIYGTVPAVVMFTQREPDGPVRIGRALRLAGGVRALHKGDDRPVIVRAVVPGGRALEAWFRRRHVQVFEWGVSQDDAAIIEDARAFGSDHWDAYEQTQDMRLSSVLTLRVMDPWLRDFEALYRLGVSYAEIADAAGITSSRVLDTLRTMRALGFDLPYRAPYARRDGSSSRAGARFDGSMDAGRKLYG